MAKVLVTEKLDIEAIRLLKSEKGLDISIDGKTTAETLITNINQYNAIIIRTYTKLTKDVINSAKNLKLIVRAGVGLDNVDVSYAKSKGIEVRNTPRANFISVAEHVFALSLSLLRNIHAADSYVKGEKGWDRNLFIGEELNGKTLGLVGIGLIGLRVAQIASAFGMKIIAYDPFVSVEAMKKEGVTKKEDILDIARESDIVSVHVPLFESTRHLVGKEFLSSMKPTAIIVNTSRGPVIDQKELIVALETKSIKGAALDVFDSEPINDKRLLSLDNVVLTPHLGAMTVEADKRMCIHAAEAVIEFFKNFDDFTSR
ncbi:MAG: hydroxyacid dehydrogenase [DPANN group archaeon]|nr:hydroxyacid dehydrogenase [DPANN group archaeon]